jgi:pimeloyl-ACP methyl ester carboxylesterase
VKVLDEIDTRLVTLETADGWTLHALHHAAPAVLAVPAGERVGLVHVHGKGANMLAEHPRWMPPALPGVEHLSLQMRSHDFATWTGRADRPAGGGMFESLADGHHDLAAGVAYLRSRGVGRVVLVGHSSGGWYVGDHSARYAGTDGAVDARVVLSPLLDNKTALAWWFPAGKGLAEFTARARELVAEGRPHQLMLIDVPYWAVSADAFLQRAGEVDGTWLRGMQADPSPVLTVWGTAEDRDPQWREALSRYTTPTNRFGAVEGGDHQYTGLEHEVCDLVARFLAEVFAVDAYAGNPHRPGTTPMETPITTPTEED